MKNFKLYNAEKYSNTDEYEKIEEGIYKHGCDYVTSLTFEMDSTRFCEEDGSPQNISQCPFEDLLDEFTVYVSDFYEDLNDNSEITCYRRILRTQQILFITIDIFERYLKESLEGFKAAFLIRLSVTLKETYLLCHHGR